MKNLYERLINPVGSESKAEEARAYRDRPEKKEGGEFDAVQK